MKTSNFPDCCAIKLLSYFGSDNSGYGSLKIPDEEIINYILENRKNSYYNNIQVITLNGHQLENIGEKLFLDLGFKIVPLGFFRPHGNNIFMLHYNPNEDGNKLK